MEVEVKSIVIVDKKKSPHFKLVTENKKFSQDAIVVKVLAFSLDPLMRVWLAGAKTNFRVVQAGNVFNCFGVGQVIQSQNDDYKVGSYIFGNTGTNNYFQLDQQRRKECFQVDQQLIKGVGPEKFLYLINNGLAAYRGFQILNVKQGETVVVSTAAGATGLLLCYLLKKQKAIVVALSSQKKRKFLQPLTDKIIDYSNPTALAKELKSIKFTKYFENVGESMLDLIIATIQNNGIIALCGAIEHYINPKEGGITNYGAITTKRLKLQGVNFTVLLPRAHEIFEQFKQMDLLVNIKKMQDFSDLFDQLFKKGGSIVGKVIINPQI